MDGLMMRYPLTLDRILEHANRMFPTKRIMTKLPNGTLHEYTYADLYRRAKRLANVLVSLDVEPGDRVGTFGWNNFQHLEMYYGIPGAGAVCHTLNIRLYYEDLMAAASEDFTWCCTDENKAMGLCYTSGTTGDPKGALYSHRSMFLHTLGENQAMGLGMVETDVVLPVVPQFHAMAWGLPYACAMAGAELIMPGLHLKPAPLAAMIEEHIVFLDALPKTSVGKFDKKVLRHRYAQGAL